MTSTLLQGRIRGVTHHRKASPLSGGVRTRHPVVLQALALTLDELRQGAPQPLSRLDVHRLLGDHGRAELHTLVLETIEHLSHWRQVSGVLDRHLTKAGPLPRKQGLETMPLLELGENAAGYVPGTEADPKQWLAIEVRRVYRLWKHRLATLEWIADGQGTAQWELRLAQRRTRFGTQRRVPSGPLQGR